MTIFDELDDFDLHSLLGSIIYVNLVYRLGITQKWLIHVCFREKSFMFKFLLIREGDSLLFSG